jgi:hypothetical protein
MPNLRTKFLTVPLLANVLFKEDHNAEAFLRDFG